ncbi:GIY-YIG nuclease family protein [Ammoniphilus resinae]|uniref:Endonuclease n=1 Tax=Ammoniphilus resinae TaxID=861532 RepID=A0ABS4GJZ7_9BACL|nr:GIY-YIG nuclease family protein [Ammoniphilus resinae]MBP1930583.1 putative endonuclease [Ammoniphilus resinae]
MKYFVYMLRCSDQSLYTGITNDIERRLDQHNKGKASKYTRARTPVQLVYQEECVDKSSALIREHEIKKYSKQRKEIMASKKE